MESGKDEEEEDLSDGSLDKQSLNVQLRNKPIINQRPGSRAPTMTIDLVRVGRPLKVLALLFSLISILCIILSACGTSWLNIKTDWIGLFQQCETIQTNDHIQSDQVKQKYYGDNNNVCKFRDFSDYEILICIILDLFGLAILIIGTILIMCGIFSLIVKHKKIFYTTAIVVDIIAGLSLLLCIIVTIIINFTKYDTPYSQFGQQVQVGWSFIVQCCAIILIVIAVILLIYDRSADEIEYRETIHRTSGLVEDEGKA